MVQVYSAPGCIQCKYTKQRLEEINVPFEEFDITKDAKARAEFDASGLNLLPMVVAGDRKWHGLKVDEIKALAS